MEDDYCGLDETEWGYLMKERRIFYGDDDVVGSAGFEIWRVVGG